MSEEKKLSVIQMFEGLTLITKMEDLLTDPEKGIRFAAVSIADDESIKKSRKDSTFLNAYIFQVEGMDPMEVAAIIRNFSEKLSIFSMSLLPKGQKK
jgi:hypothetical protein